MPSENHLARKMQVLQDLALNLASFALKMKLFLQELKNLALILQELARKICKIISLQDIIKILARLAFFLQDDFYWVCLLNKINILFQAYNNQLTSKVVPYSTSLLNEISIINITLHSLFPSEAIHQRSLLYNKLVIAQAIT